MNSLFLLLLILSPPCILAVFKFFGYLERKERTGTVIHEKIATKVIRDSETCKQAINELLSYSPLAVGIDCEWKSSQKGDRTKISLLQIANSNLILLIRLHLISPLPMKLISFLNNSNILKCGVGIYGDKSKLFKDHNIEMLGCVDLNDLHNLSNSDDANNDYLSLERMSKCILNKDLKYKHCGIDHREWESINLSLKQIHYAADDALVGYLLFRQIIKHYNINSDKYNGIIDRCSITNKTKQKQRLKKLDKKVIRSKCREVTFERFGYLCTILSVDGNVLTLGCLSLKDFLLENGEAKLVEVVENQYIIQLLHKPEIVDINMDANKLETYYRCINVPELKCFVCGRKENLSRTLLIPKNYLKYINCAHQFEYHIPVCLGHCQQKVHCWKYSFERKLLNKYGLVLDKRKNDKLNRLRGYALTLMKQKKRYQMLVETQNEWIQQIMAHFHVNARQGFVIRECHINKELDIDWYLINDYNYLIMKYYINELNLGKDNKSKEKEMEFKLYKLFQGKEIEFIEMWRKDFMQTLQPKCYNQRYETFQCKLIRKSTAC